MFKPFLFVLWAGLCWAPCHSTAQSLITALQGSEAASFGKPIEILVQPQDQTVLEGSDTLLAILIKGPYSSLQWRKNGRPIEGANSPTLNIPSVKTPFDPLQFDAIVTGEDGSILRSRAAIVRSVAPGNQALADNQTKANRDKTNAWAGFHHMLETVSALVEQPFGGWFMNAANIERHYSACPGGLKASTTLQHYDVAGEHNSIELNFNECHIPMVNSAGQQVGPTVNGIWSRTQVDHSEGTERIRTEIRRAKGVTLRFSTTTHTDHANGFFDITLNGSSTTVTTTRHLSPRIGLINRSVAWEPGSEISNPDFGMALVFEGGSHKIEQFGKLEGGRLVSGRETETYDNFRFRLGDDTFLINGQVTQVDSNSSSDRKGHFSVYKNGAHLESIPSFRVMSATRVSALPWLPSLKGGRHQDHALIALEKMGKSRAKPN